jgi:hypothetical protein
MGAASEALSARGAMGAASQRQNAMNNKVSDSTIFQQKDMQIQQAMQALQQKEQQLGVLGALMAKKAQDMQARESAGVGGLPLPENMFTAMDGGIVFAGGGDVEGYASKGMVGEYSPVPQRAGILEAAGLGVDEETPEDPLKASISSIRNKLALYETALRGTNLPPEKKAELLKAAEEKLTGQYDTYKKGIASLDAETKAALEGEAPTFQQRLGRGLAKLPTDLRGVRLGGALAALGAGAAETDAEYAKRKREAAQYMAEAKRKGLAADLAEERGRPDLARKLIAGEEADLTKAADIESKIAKTGIEAETGIAGLQLKEEVAKAQLEARERIAAANKAADKEMANARNEILLAKVRAEIAKSGAGGKTDLQTRANVAYEVLKEENANLPPDQRKSDAKLRNEAYGLAENALLGSRRTSAAASMLRAEVFNSKTLSEAMNRLRYDPVYNEASATEKRELEDAVRARFPASGAMPSGAIPYPQRSNTPPPPPGFVPNSR